MAIERYQLGCQAFNYKTTAFDQPIFKRRASHEQTLCREQSLDAMPSETNKTICSTHHEKLKLREYLQFIFYWWKDRPKNHLTVWVYPILVKK